MVERVTIKGVDVDRIEKDDSFSRAYAFYVQLSATPGPIWIELFMSLYESRFQERKSEMTIRGNQIRVVTAPGEEESNIEFLQSLVKTTNEKVDEYNQVQARREALERRMEQLKDAEAQRIRERLKKIRIA